MRRYVYTLVLFPLLFMPFLAGCGGQDPQPDGSAAQPSAAASGPSVLAASGERISLPGGAWFTWEFTEKPKLGTVIVKVKAFMADGSRSTSYAIAGESGMPSMRYHDSGTVDFKLNKRGDYLLPVDVVMPGEWQLTIKVKTGEQEVYEGKVIFNI
jgi:hypothetical protein